MKNNLYFGFRSSHVFYTKNSTGCSPGEKQGMEMISWGIQKHDNY